MSGVFRHEDEEDFLSSSNSPRSSFMLIHWFQANKTIIHHNKNPISSYFEYHSF